MIRSKKGTVVSARPDQTVVVQVDHHEVHPKYGKRFRVSTKFHAHDPKNAAAEGDLVTICECRPISKLKKWRLVSVDQKAEKVLEVKKEEVEIVAEEGKKKPEKELEKEEAPQKESSEEAPKEVSPNPKEEK